MLIVSGIKSIIHICTTYYWGRTNLVSSGYYIYKGGDILAQDAIRKIQEAEARAAKTIEEAMEESKKIVGGAQEEALAEYDSIIAKANSKARAMKEEAQKKGEDEASPVLTRGEEDVKAIQNTSKEKINSAVSLVIGRIVKFNGNS